MSLHKEFKLSAALYGHSLDVRYVDINYKNCIISASRDKTCKLWIPNELNSGYAEAITYKGHKNFVSSVCALLPSAEFINGVIISGGNDNNICVYLPDISEPIITIKGHENTVCSITPGNEPNTFLSSSWDCKAKLWQLSNSALNELAVFNGHQMSVWAVVQLPNGNVVTGSADKDIVIWTQYGQLIKTLKGHTDCVRGLTVLNEKTFASVSNDASIKLWTMDGVCLDTLYGHENYIYSICANKALGEDYFVTCGEDRQVKCWQNGDCIQTIMLPAQSVWSVACLANGDIVTGSSDGVVRVFTHDPGRLADEQQLKLFQEEVEKLTRASNQEIGGVKITDLPGKEVLYEPGKSDGQTKLIREGDSVTCYSWSAAEGTWNKVGDVMGAAGGTQATSGKTLYEGKEYDFVFSVDIEDGKPPIKLPYNKDQDPWFAAQEFIHKNNLPQVYLEQVANFIVQNSGSVVITQQSNDFYDPFTGENRYVPGSSNAANSNGTTGMNLDPFTGGSSYTTSSGTAIPASARNTAPLPANPDPFTSSVSYSTKPAAAQQQVQQTTYTYFPHLSYLFFEQGNLGVIHEKLKQFNNQNNENMSNVDENVLDGIVKLANGPADEMYIKYLNELLEWPHDIVFPVLDILRLAVRHSVNNDKLCSQDNGKILLERIRSCIVQNSAANKMLALRILCNMFSHSSGESLILSNEHFLCSDITNIGKNLNKNCQIALATFLLNLSIALVKKQNISRLMPLLELTSKTVVDLSDPEAEFRAFVALGTILLNVNKSSVLVQAPYIIELRGKLAKICSIGTSDTILLRNINCAQQLNSLFL